MTDKLSTGNAFTMFQGKGFLSNDKQILRSERNKAGGIARAKQELPANQKKFKIHQERKALNK
jgi:hypothetical protein